MFRFARRILAATALAVLALVPPALAGQPITQTLTPPPPSFLICKAVGNGTICEGQRSFAVDPYDTEIVCGSGLNAFDIIDQGTVRQIVIRYYDGDGNLTRRVIHESWTSAAYSNSLTGATVPYHQQNTITDILAVPGDFGTATETVTGETVFTAPHVGAVLLNAGKSVFGADGTVEFRSGPQNFLDYFVDGDTSVVDRLCAALGA